MASYVRRDIVGGAPQTTLTSDPGSGGTTIAITSGTGWPTGSNGNFYICIDRGNSGEEKVLCSSRSGTNITVASSGRGADGTTAAAHAVGVNVEHIITAVDADEANYAVSKTVGLATAVGQILVVDATNSFAAVQGKTSGQVLLGNGTTVASTALSGDVTVNGSGVTAIGAGKVTSAMILDGTIVTGDIATGAITSTNILNGTIVAADIADGTITDAKLATPASGGIDTGSGTPSSTPSTGGMYYDTTNNLLYAYNSSGAWVCITPKSASVATSQTTSSSSFTDLSTSGPAVTVVTGTKAVVTVGALMIPPASGACYMGFAVSSATTAAATAAQSVSVFASTGGGANSLSKVVYLSGLTAGSNVFTAKYESSGGSSSFADRYITVVGIP